MSSSENPSPADPAASAFQPKGITRRELIKQGALWSTVAVMAPSLRAASEPGNLKPDLATGSVSAPVERVKLDFILNGKPVQVTAEARVNLLDLLRDQLDLPGTKKGCDHGQCGACTVLIDGRRKLSCLSLAAAVNGKSVTTIEGLAKGDELHPMQTAFIDHDAFQCGYCTPGQIVSAVGFAKEPWDNTKEAIREGMSGNLCRCGAYCGIVAAVEKARSASASLSI